MVFRWRDRDWYVEDVFVKGKTREEIEARAEKGGRIHGFGRDCAYMKIPYVKGLAHEVVGGGRH